MNPADYSLIGYLDDEKVIAMQNTTRQNMLVLGEIGSGKSSILRLLIMQDIKNKRGFLLAENHSELSGEILSMIPPDQYDKLVYVNLGSIRKYEKTLRFNPLEIKDPHDAGMIALNFTESLAAAFADSWGARVETCARNGALSVIGTQSNTLGTMLKLLTDKEFRQSFVPQITNRQAKDFFVNVYDNQYPKEAGGVIFNKLNKMLTIPEMDAMFNTEKSSVTFEKIINDAMYVVLDFGGLPNDMVMFLGNIFLHLFYTQYKKRAKNSDGKYDTFNLYLDEVQMFSATMIRELLNTVRKYGIKATIATQSASALDGDLADEIMTLCRSVACFRCDAVTAAHLKSVLPIKPEQQQQLSFHHFSFYSAGDKPVRAVAKTRHVQVIDRSETAAQASVNNLGIYVSLDKYYTQKGGDADVILTPLEFGILNLLRVQNRDMTKQEITSYIEKRYASHPRMISSALQDTLIAANAFVAKKDTISDDGDDTFESRYVITKTAIDRIFSKAAAGRRAGGDLHLSTIFMVMDVQTNMGNYCVPDLGKNSVQKADLLIHSPQKISDAYQNTRYHPSEWSENVIAVEVETEPGKHWEQAYKNWEKSAKKGHNVWFIVYDKSIKDGIIAELERHGVAKNNYSIQIIDKACLTNNSAQIKRYSEIESIIIKTLIDYKGVTTQKNIIEELWRFEQQEVLGGLEHLQKTHNIYRTNPDATSANTTWSILKQDGEETKLQVPQMTDMPHTLLPVVVLPETNSETASATKIQKKNNYADLTEQALFYIWQECDIYQKEEIKTELQRRGYMIKSRLGNFFLSKIPSL